jgi:hypothetical protein
MNHVGMPVSYYSRAELVDALEYDNTLDHHHIRPGLVYITWSSKRSDTGTLDALEEYFGNQDLAAVYCNRLKRRTQLAGESIQEFATTEVLCLQRHRDHVRRKGGKVFVDAIEDTA